MKKQILSFDKIQITFYSFFSLNKKIFPLNLFFSHANGFHGQIFKQTILNLTSHPSPTLSSLNSSSNSPSNSPSTPLSTSNSYSYNCFSIDLRGHGQSFNSLPNKFNWELMSKDILIVLDEISKEDEQVIGIGHSFGAAALLIAALKNPKKFNKLILYEPVVFPFYFRFISRFFESPLAKAALKRRKSFTSVEAAIENFSSKQPMKSFHPEVLKDYCTYGLTQINEKEWTLSCSPENEAAVFRSGSEHTTMNDLHKINIPILLITGRDDPTGLSRFMPDVAKKLPNCKFVKWEEYGHLGPMENPQKFADAIREFVETPSP